MSGQSAMQMRFEKLSPEALPADCNPAEAEVAWEFAADFVRSAAAVIEGAKPAALFSYKTCERTCGCASRCTRMSLALRVVATYADELPAHGMRLEVLGSRGGRIHLLAWRPASVQGLAAKPGVKAFLAQRGVTYEGADDLAQAFVSLLRAFHAGESHAYPHEVGVLLGYPLEDVAGYLDGGCETCRGPWRSYGDADAARKRFKRIEESEKSCKRRYASGLTLSALLASA